MTAIIKNIDILFGSELQLIQNGMIIVNDQGKIEKAGKTLDIKNSKYYLKIVEKKNTSIIDAEGYLITPGLVNSHTHIGDAIGKDISSNSDLDTRVHPNHSIKKTILEKTETDHLKQFMKNAAITMLNKGITTFVDFRECGLSGVILLQTALKDIPIKSIILGRIDLNSFYGDKMYKKRVLRENSISSSTSETKKNDLDEKRFYKMGSDILNICDGFGISGANEHDDRTLAIYKNIIKETNKQNRFDRKDKLLVAIHAAESILSGKESLNNTGKTEIERTIFTLDPDLYIHVTNPTKHDLDLLESTQKGIVVCPRANGILGVGFVPLREMLERGFDIAIGTDNIMINSPDIFKEMDFLLKSQRAFEKNNLFLDAKMVLKMATVNGGKIFNRNIGCIDNGYQADLLFIDEYDIDMYPIHDPYMSIIHRCSERAIKAIMIDGKFVDAKYCIN
ncbi:MAG TPA: amidohydrolase family protein [Candidatus Sulfopaludibacter sp.]|nr:amidohydrolase family protein [Candidatus Sulfopaludibacter sp.]